MFNRDKTLEKTKTSWPFSGNVFLSSRPKSQHYRHWTVHWNSCRKRPRVKEVKRFTTLVKSTMDFRTRSRFVSATGVISTSPGNSNNSKKITTEIKNKILLYLKNYIKNHIVFHKKLWKSNLLRWDPWLFRSTNTIIGSSFCFVFVLRLFFDL